MPAELSNLENSAPKGTIFRAKSEGEEISKAMAKKESKGNATTKKICICAPTSHAGSFRCHLHRTNNNAPTKLSSTRYGQTSSQSHTQPQLSRFYTSASVNVTAPNHDDKPETNTRFVNKVEL